MRAWFLVAIVLPLFFSVDPAAAAQSEGKVSGQMLVVTHGFRSTKLPDVEVRLYEAKSLYAYIRQRDEEASEPRQLLAAAAQAAEADHARKLQISQQKFAAYKASNYDPASGSISNQASLACGDAVTWSRRVQAAQAYSVSARYYFEQLPTPLRTTRTDRDGHFSLPVPHEGSFVLAAHASHTVPNENEEYYWLVTIAPEGVEQITENLTNENMAGSGSAVSLVHTVDAQTEGQARSGEAVALDLLSKRRQAAEKETAAAREKTEAAERAAKAEASRNLPRLVKESQARALQNYPALGVANSPLNKRFVQEYQRLQSARSGRLQQPDWPEKLAAECATAP